MTIVAKSHRLSVRLIYFCVKKDLTLENQNRLKSHGFHSLLLFVRKNNLSAGCVQNSNNEIPIKSNKYKINFHNMEVLHHAID